MLASTCPAPAQKITEEVEGVAGIVNTDVITHWEVRELAGPKIEEARETLRGAELVNKVKELRAAAAAVIVDRLLILQAAAAQKLVIPESAVDERIQSVIDRQFGGDEPRFYKYLSARGYTLDRFRQRQRDDLAVEKMRTAETSQASTPEEAKQVEEKWLQGLRQRAYIKLY